LGGSESLGYSNRFARRQAIKIHAGPATTLLAMIAQPVQTMIRSSVLGMNPT
jgi:hypothetical protein